jgi:hypothetical protein
MTAPKLRIQARSTNVNMDAIMVRMALCLESFFRPFSVVLCGKEESLGPVLQAGCDNWAW